MTFKYKGEGWYITRGGEKVYVTGEIPREVPSGYKYIGLQVAGLPKTWTSSGNQFRQCETELDLLHKVKEKSTLWLNISKSEGVREFFSAEDAYDLQLPDDIACVKVEYEEGQFDE